jgi:GTP cyclohydrolase IA
MKLNAISLNIPHKAVADIDEVGDNHFATSLETPLREDAFDLSNEEKINKIEAHFHEIMEIMGLDMTDESLSGTPRRVAKMYVNELFSGLNPEAKPPATLFSNSYNYSQMLVEKNITFFSTCEHHFVPIYGKAHVAYISSGQVIGLSKLNRIVQYYARRPQVQERLTEQIAAELKSILKTDDVAVIMDANHMCVASRGVRDTHSSTVTAAYYGKFKDHKVREELLHYIAQKTV